MKWEDMRSARRSLVAQQLQASCRRRRHVEHAVRRRREESSEEGVVRGAAATLLDVADGYQGLLLQPSIDLFDLQTSRIGLN